eukprot:15072971-Alexandrium_andersonii.AAC.1
MSASLVGSEMCIRDSCSSNRFRASHSQSSVNRAGGRSCTRSCGEQTAEDALQRKILHLVELCEDGCGDLGSRGAEQ